MICSGFSMHKNDIMISHLLKQKPARNSRIGFGISFRSYGDLAIVITPTIMVLRISDYLSHPVLGSRLREISEALLAIEGKSANQILGHIDALKVRSSMTLFDAVCPNDIFCRVIDKYYAGEKDLQTMEMISPNPTKLSAAASKISR